MPQLHACWRALLQHLNPASLSGLSQSFVDNLLFEALVTALHSGDEAAKRAVQLFWDRAGVQEALHGYDLAAVEAALQGELTPARVSLGAPTATPTCPESPMSAFTMPYDMCM